MQAAGRSDTQIATSLSAIQRRARIVGRRDLRLLPGVAHHTSPLVLSDALWSQNIARDGAEIPLQIAERLRGRYFSSYRAFRRAVWIAAADIPEISQQFGRLDQIRMQSGAPPLVLLEQRYGNAVGYEIHHRLPIGRRGRVYDMSNMIIVTPRRHQTILDPRVHHRPIRDGDE